MDFQQFLAEKNKKLTVVVRRSDLLRQIRRLGLAVRQLSATDDEITGTGESFRLSHSLTVTVSVNHWEIEHGARLIRGLPGFVHPYRWIDQPCHGSFEERLVQHFARPVTLTLPEPVVFDDDDYECGGSGWVFRSQLRTRLEAKLKHLEAL